MRPIRAAAAVLISLALFSGVGSAAPAGDDRAERTTAEIEKAGGTVQLREGLAVSLGSGNHGQAARRGREQHARSVVASPVDPQDRLWSRRPATAWGRYLDDRAETTAQGSGKRGPRRAMGDTRYERDHLVNAPGRADPQTRGTPEENGWGLAKARYDAETFWYRGNGSVDVVPDTVFLESGRADEYRDRNVIVYGHSESRICLEGVSPWSKRISP
jgi:hypothetical protein